MNLAGIVPTVNLRSEGQSGLFISYAGKKDVSSSQIPFSTMLCLLAARKHVKAALKDWVSRTSLSLKNKSIFLHPSMAQWVISKRNLDD